MYIFLKETFKCDFVYPVNGDVMSVNNYILNGFLLELEIPWCKLLS